MNEERLKGLTEAGVYPFSHINTVAYTGDNEDKIPKEPEPLWSVLLGRLPNSVEYFHTSCVMEFKIAGKDKLRVEYIEHTRTHKHVFLRYDNIRNGLSLEDMLADALIDLHKRNLL